MEDGCRRTERMVLEVVLMKTEDRFADGWRKAAGRKKTLSFTIGLCFTRFGSPFGFLPLSIASTILGPRLGEYAAKLLRPACVLFTSYAVSYQDTLYTDFLVLVLARARHAPELRSVMDTA